MHRRMHVYPQSRARSRSAAASRSRATRRRSTCTCSTAPCARPSAPCAASSRTTRLQRCVAAVEPFCVLLERRRPDPLFLCLVAGRHHPRADAQVHGRAGLPAVRAGASRQGGREAVEEEALSARRDEAGLGDRRGESLWLQALIVTQSAVCIAGGGKEKSANNEMQLWSGGKCKELRMESVKREHTSDDFPASTHRDARLALAANAIVLVDLLARQHAARPARTLHALGHVKDLPELEVLVAARRRDRGPVGGSCRSAGCASGARAGCRQSW